MTLNTCIFDVDGTLADTEEAHRQSFNQAFQNLGLHWNWDQPRYRQLLKVTGGKERIAAYVATLALADAERGRLVAMIPELHRAKTAIYTQKVKGGDVALRDGVTRLFAEARAGGIRLAIATTTSFANIEILFEAAFGSAALQQVAAIASGDDVARKKPAPDVYLSILQQLGVSADHCVAFEDSANGLASARAAGLFTVVTPNFWTQDEDFSEADLLLPTLGSATAPLPAAVAAQLGARWLSLSLVELRLLTRNAGRA